MDEQNANQEQQAETPGKNGKTRRFIGSFNHSLDAKGRLVIPQSFREKLGESFCLAPSYDFRSIAIYPTEMWEKRNREFEQLDSFNPMVNEYLEQFYALSYDEQACDGQGRVLLPANIRSKILGEEKDVEITGANDHIRVVAEKLSNNSWNNFRGNLPQILEVFGSLQKQR